MNAVMISIQPIWVEKILSGEKTFEVRKTKPKLQVPFKCYIYCTSIKPMNLNEYVEIYRSTGGAIDNWHGKVVAEFTCDEINTIQSRGINDNFDYCYESLNIFGNDDIAIEITAIKKSCIKKSDLNTYSQGSKVIYGWHISNLVAYDKPKELSKFNLKRPLQSWCYVEGSE